MHFALSILCSQFLLHYVHIMCCCARKLLSAVCARKLPCHWCSCQPARPWAASGVASLLSCPSVRLHAHGQLPRAPTTACILCAANIAADNADMFSSRIAVVVVLAVASTGSAFQNEGETRNLRRRMSGVCGFCWGGGGALSFEGG